MSVYDLEDMMTEPTTGDTLADLIPGCKRLRLPEEEHLMRTSKYILVFRKFIEFHE